MKSQPPQSPASAPKPPPLEREHGLKLLTNMLRVRRMEEKCAELYSAQKIRGFLHLYVGEEAVAGGIFEVLELEDAVVGTYREHGHALLKGVSMRRIMAEMYGKQEGCSRGRGGSMHLFDAETRFYGGNGIVGGGLPVAVGLALAAKLQQTGQVVACFFGEGAMAEGEFHESINLAALWQLPVVFCCENNRYAMGTALERSESQVDLRAKAASYDVHAETVDGMDVTAVEATARRVIQSVREGDGPAFLELQTYRFRAHSMFDPELYRDKWEVEEHKHRDPLVTFPDRLSFLGLLEPADLERIEAEVAREVADAVEFAEQGTWEPVEELTRFVYSDPRVVQS